MLAQALAPLQRASPWSLAHAPCVLALESCPEEAGFARRGRCSIGFAAVAGRCRRRNIDALVLAGVLQLANRDLEHARQRKRVGAGQSRKDRCSLQPALGGAGLRTSCIWRRRSIVARNEACREVSWSWTGSTAAKCGRVV